MNLSEEAIKFIKNNNKLMKKMINKKVNSYFDLSPQEKKDIITGAIREANKEQLEVVKRYGVGRHSKCQA